jgi:hypothetical protein
LAGAVADVLTVRFALTAALLVALFGDFAPATLRPLPRLVELFLFRFAMGLLNRMNEARKANERLALGQARGVIGP